MQMVERHSKAKEDVVALSRLLIEWINQQLQDERILVRDLEEDLFDGQILQKLLERIFGVGIDEPEFSQTEQGQKQRLRKCLELVNAQLGVPPQWAAERWSVERIYSKFLVDILRLLVALARHCRVSFRIPEGVRLDVVTVIRRDGLLQTRRDAVPVTEDREELMVGNERDTFDLLFVHAPEKLQQVSEAMMTFLNKQLVSVGLTIEDLSRDLADGVPLLLTMGLLEGYFVPLHCYHSSPATTEQRLHNVNLAYELMQDAGLPRPKSPPEDVVNGDLKAILRVIYTLFSEFKDRT